VRRDALPFFEQVSDLDRLCALVPQWATQRPKKIMQDNSLDDPVVLADLAYAAIVRGNEHRAVPVARRCCQLREGVRRVLNDELLTGLEYMLDLVQRLGLEAAQAQLEEWYRHNIDSLKLES
jgi:hypothetical protein